MIYNLPEVCFTNIAQHYVFKIESGVGATPFQQHNLIVLAKLFAFYVLSVMILALW